MPEFGPTYGDHFQFQRIWEGVNPQVGDFSVPSTGNFWQGCFAQQDASNPNFLKLGVDNAQLIPGVSGLLIQEEWMDSNYLAPITESSEYRRVIHSRGAVLVTGAGIRVRVSNLPARTINGGKARLAFAPLVPTGLAIGDGISWKLAAGVGQYTKTTGDYTNRIGTVVAVDTSVSGAESVDFVLAN